MATMQDAYRKKQKKIPVGCKVTWTSGGTFHVNQEGHKLSTGVVVSHTEWSGMTQVRDRKGVEFRAPCCVFQIAT
jgi:hypothetical protein